MKLNSPRFGAWFSTFAYLIVASIKIIIALQTTSVALLADGLNNLTDIVTSVALIIGLYIAKKKRDDNHPYGHLRAEKRCFSISLICYCYDRLSDFNGYNSFHY